jgi:nucleoid DNA-binding protein
MLSNIKIKDTVYSKFYGIGKVIAIRLNCDYPVEVEFLSGEVEYTLDGEYWNSESNRFGKELDKNITLLPAKVGSKDARRIVAMLASNVRLSKNTSINVHLSKYGNFQYTSDNKRIYTASMRAMREYHVYQQAKQLLGEHK